MDSTSLTQPAQPRSSKKLIISVLLLTIFMLTIPFGVYLVSQRTNFLPRASVENQNLETSLTLEPGAQEENGNISVSILIASDKDPVNLINAQIEYPSEFLAVDAIDASSPDLDQNSQAKISRKIIESDSSKNGDVLIILGIPEGIKTEPGKKFTVAKVNFKARAKGNTQISLKETSALFKSSDNSKISIPKKDISLNLAYSSLNIPDLNKKPCQPKPECLTAKPACSLPEPEEGWCKEGEAMLKIVSPNGGETYSYKNEIPIKWEAQNIKNVSISLLLNGNLMGKIATAEAAVKSYLWDPLRTLTYAFIYPYNAFQVELESVGEDGERIIEKSAGPFALTLDEVSSESTKSAKVVNGNGDLNGDGAVDLTDLSVLISNYKKDQVPNKNSDLNGDNLVNDIDIWLLKGLLSQ